MLWDDKRIGDEFAPVGVADYAGIAYDAAVTTANKMRDEYERALVKANEEAGRLAQELKQARVKIAELERWPDTWRPITFETLKVDQDEMLIDTGSELRFRSHNGSFDFGILLPKDIRLCRKVQP